MRSGVQSCQPRHQPDVGLYRPVGKQAAVLDHVAHAAAQADGVPLGGRAARKANHAAGKRHQPVDGLEQRGLAGAAAAQQHDGFALAHVQADVAQNRAPADAAREIAYFEKSVRHGSFNARTVQTTPARKRRGRLKPHQHRDIALWGMLELARRRQNSPIRPALR